MNTAAKKYIVEIICYLFLFLFVYAAVSKLITFQNFQAQLGQSPLISVYAGIVSYAVLSVELIVAILLAIPKFKLAGLYASFSLMVMFTVYIVFILNFSINIPCSCGGILEKMGWKEHLAFNVAFTILGIIAILCHNPENQTATL